MTLQDHAYRPVNALPQVVPNDFLERIQSAAREVRDADDFRNLTHQRRNQLIVEAVDAGVSQRAVARAAGLAQTRIIALLSRSQEDRG
jgi:hypothetical protein